RQRPFRCFGLVGAQGGEGTTTASLGLAAAFAKESDLGVLLVESVLRAPRLGKLLGLPDGLPGLHEWLLGRGDEAIPVQRIEPWGFHLLLAGGPATDPAELVGSERMAQLLVAARERFETTVVDCPALTPWSDTVVLQQYLDGLLLVLRARYTPREDIRRALTHVKPGLVEGIVFNDRDDVFERWRRRRSRRT